MRMLTRCLAAVAVALILAACGGRPTAAPRPTVRPTARYATAAAVVDDVVFVIGGVSRSADADAPVGTVEAYDPESRMWTRCAALATPRAFAAAAAVRGRIHVFGGLDATGNALDTVEVYDPAKDLWSAAPSMDAKRSRLAAVAHAGRSILVAGGLDADQRNSSEVRILHGDGTGWLNWGSLPSARHGLALADADDGSDRAFAVGGYDESGPLDRVDMFGAGAARGAGPDGQSHPLGYGWWPKPPLAHARGFHGLAKLGTHLYAVGGRCREIPPTEVLDIDDVDAGWKPAAPLPRDLCRFAIVAWKDRLLVFGGETDGGKSVSTDVLEYDPDADRWSVR